MWHYSGDQKVNSVPTTKWQWPLARPKSRNVMELEDKSDLGGEGDVMWWLQWHWRGTHKSCHFFWLSNLGYAYVWLWWDRCVHVQCSVQYVSARTCVWVCVCVGQKSTSGVAEEPRFVWQGLSLAPGIHSSLFTHCWYYKQAPPFYWVSGILLGCSELNSSLHASAANTLPTQTILPAPIF